jgi:large-conductance mechanosensitive channel
VLAMIIYFIVQSFRKKKNKAKETHKKNNKKTNKAKDGEATAVDGLIRALLNSL